MPFVNMAIKSLPIGNNRLAWRNQLTKALFPYDGLCWHQYFAPWDCCCSVTLLGLWQKTEGTKGHETYHLGTLFKNKKKKFVFSFSICHLVIAWQKPVSLHCCRNQDEVKLDELMEAQNSSPPEFPFSCSDSAQSSYSDSLEYFKETPLFSPSLLWFTVLDY